jgi:hypothetical protein
VELPTLIGSIFVLLQYAIAGWGKPHQQSDQRVLRGLRSAPGSRVNAPAGNAFEESPPCFRHLSFAFLLFLEQNQSAISFNAKKPQTYGSPPTSPHLLSNNSSTTLGGPSLHLSMTGKALNCSGSGIEESLHGLCTRTCGMIMTCWILL